MPGFPFTTGLALLGSLAFLVGSVVSDWEQQLEVAAAAGAQLSGVPAHRRRQRRGPPRDHVMRFTRAIVRPPAATFAAGITSSGLGPPDLALALEQHEAYCRTLERLGLSLIRLPPDPDFPDSTFVEDAAIVTTRGAILTRPGAPSRAGEVAALGAALGRWFPELAEITAPGTVDGGDVCEAGEHFFIGVSQRTNAEGAAQLGEWLGSAGLRLQRDRYPTDARPAAPQDRALLAGRAAAARHGARSPDTRRSAGGRWCRCRRARSTRPTASGSTTRCWSPGVSRRPRARSRELGYDLVELDMSEYRKMDGGLSCLSVRW